MKFDPIGRSLMRYFRQAAISAWGKVSRTHALPIASGPRPVAYFIDAAGDLHANYGGAESYRLTCNPEALRAALRTIQADPFPSSEPPPPPLTWAVWTEMQAEVDRPGWTFCRFGLRTPNGGVGQVFGYVHDDFGIYGKSFYVSAPVNDKRQLWSLVSLRSGLGIGLFCTPSEAGEAGDIAARLGVQATTEDLAPGDWIRFQKALRAASFNVSPNMHAHQLVDDEIVPGELCIWQFDIMSDITTRPERLS